MFNSLQPCVPQYARLLCPLLSCKVCSNSCPLSRRCYLTISSSAAPSSFCLQSFPASGSFPMNQLFVLGGPSIGVSTSASIPSNEYWGLISFTVDLFDLLAVQGTLKSLLQHQNSKASILQHSTLSMVQILQLNMTTKKTIALIIWTFFGKVTSLLFNTFLFFFLVIAFFQGASLF